MARETLVMEAITLPRRESSPDDAPFARSTSQEGKTKPHVCVVVPNWNGWRDTRECLESLLASTAESHLVAWMVVDNGSTDDSVARLAEWAREKGVRATVASEGGPVPEDRFWNGLILLTLPRNRGYAGACNAGLRLALAQPQMTHCVVLNNDTVVTRGFIEALTEAAPPRELVLVGGRITYTHQPNENWYAGGYVDWLRVHGKHWTNGPEEGKPMPVTFVTGCLFLVTRALLEQVGLMSEHYFLYYEDVDYSVRAARHGARVLYQPASVIRHKVSATIGSVDTSPWAAFLATRNRLWFARSYLSGVRLAAALGFAVASRAIIALRALGHARPRVAGAVVRGVLRGLMDDPSAVAEQTPVTSSSMPVR